MNLIFWKTAGKSPEEEKYSSPSYHCLFKVDKEMDVDIDIELFNNFRVSAADKDAFIQHIVSKVKEVIENYSSQPMEWS